MLYCPIVNLQGKRGFTIRIDTIRRTKNLFEYKEDYLYFVLYSWERGYSSLELIL